MQTIIKICKFYLLLSFGLHINANPVVYGQKTPSNYEHSSSSFHSESSFSSIPGFENMGMKSSLQPVINGDQSFTNVPSVTTTFRDQNGNLVTQVKKEMLNNENGQSSRTFEFQENKQLPNGYSKSFKKEYSSSSVSQPTTLIQNPINVNKNYNSEKLLNGECCTYEQSFQNYQGSSIPSNSEYVGIKSDLKSTLGLGMTNVPSFTTTFRDQNGNIVTQVKKEIINNDNGQNSHISEFEETKQLPNGYSKSFKKEYSSSSSSVSQPTTFIQNPMSTVKNYNSEKLINGASSTYGQSLQNYQGHSIPVNSGYVGIQSNLKSTVGQQGMTNVPSFTTTFRDQNGNIVTQVKKEIINNDNGQNSHISEFEETKQLPNGYSKSFKKEYSSSSVSQPTAISQGIIGQQSKLQGPIGQPLEKIESFSTQTQKGVGQKSVDLHGFSKPSLVVHQPVDIGHFQKPITPIEKVESFPAQTQEVGQQSVNYHDFSNPSSTGQQLLNIGQPSKPLRPIGQQFEKIESFSTQTQEEVGQQSVDFHDFSKPSPIGKQSLNIGQLSQPQRPNGQQFEKIESFSTQTQEEVGQQSVDLHGFSNPSPIGQQPLNIGQLSKPLRPNGQPFEKIESFSTQTQEVGQQSIDLHDFSKPSFIGQQSLNIGQPSKPLRPNGQQFEKIETFSTQTQEEIGQQSVDLHSFSNPSPTGQQSLNIGQPSKPQRPNGPQFEKIESFSTQTQEEIGQQSVDLHSFSNPSPTGQQSLNIGQPSKPLRPNGQQFEKIESFSTQTQEVGQQSIDLHGFSKPSPIGQQSLNIGQLSKPQRPNGQQFEKIESFSTQTQEEIGQQSVDLHSFSNPSPTGQQSLNIGQPSKPLRPNGQQFEKIESFSTQTQEVGQQSIDLHDFSKPSFIGQQSLNIGQPSKPLRPNGQQFEKIESFSTQTQEEIGQQSVDLHGYSKPASVIQQSVNIVHSQKPNGQFNKTESFSGQIQKEFGQQSIDLYDYSKPSQIGQLLINDKNQVTPKTPISQKFEKVESFSAQTQEVGQQSVDFHEFTKPSPVGQQSIVIGHLSKPQRPIGQQFEKIESFSTQTQEVGQQSVDLNDFSKPSPIGQKSLNIGHPQKPIGKFEKIESFLGQTQKEFGQQSVDFHGFSKPSPVGQEAVDIRNIYTPENPTGHQFENKEVSYQNKYKQVGHQAVNINDNGKSSQYGMNQQTFSQPSVGQQIQGLDFLTTYGDTTHLLDLGALGQQPKQNQYNGQLLVSSKPMGQQTVESFESHSTLEKNINLSNLDYLPTNVENYQKNDNINHHTLYGQSMNNPAIQGQQTTVNFSDIEGHRPTYQKSNYGSTDFQTSEFSSHTGKSAIGKEQPVNSKYNSVFDKLGQLEHEVLGAKSSVNLNKDNFQTSFSTNHNVKSMPVQSSHQESHFSKTTNENIQYIEPESEIISGTNDQLFSSGSFVKESKSNVQQNVTENQRLNKENFLEQHTTQSSVWKKMGDKFKGTIQNAKSKAQQLASNINSKVGFLKENTTENPC